MLSLRRSTKILIAIAVIVVILSVFFVKVQTPGRTAVRKAEYYKDLYYSYQRHNKEYKEYKVLAEQYYEQARFELREVLDREPENTKALYWLVRANKVKSALDYGEYNYNHYAKQIFYAVCILLGIIVLGLIIAAAGKSLKRRRHISTDEGMVCPECFAPAAEDDKSCRNCGAEFEEDAERNGDNVIAGSDGSGKMPDEPR